MDDLADHPTPDQAPPEQACAARPGPVTHPPQPLTKDELRAVIAILRDGFGPQKILFETIELLEPEKPFLAAWAPGQPIPRAARANAFRADEAGCGA